MQDLSQYEHPHISVDIIVFTIREGELQVALIERGQEPFKGVWALPGGFVRVDESLEAAAKRELEEEVGVSDVYLEQLYTFGEVRRDPRARVITVAYFALVPAEKLHLVAASDAADARWFSMKGLPALAFDHADILGYALNRLRDKIEYSSISYGLLPEKFRLRDLQGLYEAILGQPLDKRNFRKKMLSLGLIEATGEQVRGGAHRPAELFRFKERTLQFFE
jgi:8-oxo-dGTP diphosphatase